ncbi:hypothetical protein [Usitatibacter palustris]|uniref:Uncharacterized protein n=1 Tax=Usitatibacter palustris TaxID=2732487 RepID=A0A6M4HDW9_9PROT|nr:hypothetical protein [Usitatibacter palustris]QJR16703.1 hypothetical protein DSM104440_03539 [Usitatibacter palustris]
MIASNIAVVAAIFLMGQAVGLSPSESRELFLRDFERALASRDSKALIALSDAGSWSAAGYPSLSDLPLQLPTGPVSRVRDLSDDAVLYEDARGRPWRLTITQGNEGKRLAVIRSAPCPRPDRRQGNATVEEAVNSWTVLECWPLPR